MSNAKHNGDEVWRGIDQLLAVMRQLRAPEGGCPWDIKQDMQSLVPYTIEEAYEVAAAVAEADPEDIRGELGDLLFQVVFYAQIASEDGWFDFDQVASSMAQKLIRRHPHVFGDEQVTDAYAVKQRWEELKREEREQKGGIDTVFADVPANLPSILKAMKIQKRAASVGFDWPTVAPVIDKIEEEIEEVRGALATQPLHQAHVEEEIGDLLFAVVNLARHAKVNPETALSKANQKFMARFRFVEQQVAAASGSFSDYDLNTLEAFWQKAKQKD